MAPPLEVICERREGPAWSRGARPSRRGSVRFGKRERCEGAQKRPRHVIPQAEGRRLSWLLRVMLRFAPVPVMRRIWPKSFD